MTRRRATLALVAALVAAALAAEPDQQNQQQVPTPAAQQRSLQLVELAAHAPLPAVCRYGYPGGLATYCLNWQTDDITVKSVRYPDGSVYYSVCISQRPELILQVQAVWYHIQTGETQIIEEALPWRIEAGGSTLYCEQRLWMTGPVAPLWEPHLVREWLQWLPWVVEG